MNPRRQGKPDILSPKEKELGRKGISRRRRDAASLFLRLEQQALDMGRATRPLWHLDSWIAAPASANDRPRGPAPAPGWRTRHFGTPEIDLARLSAGTDQITLLEVGL